MYCIECTKDCPMKTEKYMNIQTPCFVCARGANMPEPECWDCIKGKCMFVDGDSNDVQGLPK